MTAGETPKHTPLPWELLENISGSFIARDGKQIGRILKLEDATLIVQAVNERDALLARVERLEKTLEFIAEGKCECSPPTCSCDYWYASAAKEALSRLDERGVK